MRASEHLIITMCLESIYRQSHVRAGRRDPTWRHGAVAVCVRELPVLRHAEWPIQTGAIGAIDVLVEAAAFVRAGMAWLSS